MNPFVRILFSTALTAALLLPNFRVAHADRVKVVHVPHDPYGYPRPGDKQRDVPLRTSFYVVFGVEGEDPADRILPETLSLSLQPEGGKPASIVEPGPRFAKGYAGKVAPGGEMHVHGSVSLYVDSETPLRPRTTYQVRVVARSRKGLVLSGPEGTWSFTTEELPNTRSLRFELDLAPTRATRWHGAHFSGFVKPAFCTSDPVALPSYDLMDAVRRKWPKAWSLQRDAYMTAFEHGSAANIMPRNHPSVVRELETRRIAAMRDAGATGSPTGS